MFLCFILLFLYTLHLACLKYSCMIPTLDRGWDGAVGIATCYGLDDPGIESWWGRDFMHPSRLDLGPTQSPIQWVPDLSQG
jgi:hypothetical protein